MSDEQEGSSEGGYQEAKVILIVEDDDDIGDFLQQALAQETPYHAVRVEDGFAALKIIHDLKPDLIILDYQLPQMNGIEVYDQLRTMEGGRDIPVIFMTASTGMPWHQLEKRKAIGLGKPLELSTFLEIVEKLLTAAS
jgi:CheY-like chemotaxis protein